MCIKMNGTEQPLPPKAELLTDNGISRVYRGHDGFIYKRSIPFLIENEFYFLKRMWDETAFDDLFVPFVSRWDKYTIKMFDLRENLPITDKEEFISNMDRLLGTLSRLGIRHGDLTRYSIIVRNNWPHVIDFAESRRMGDPRPDKRSEGDEYWIRKTTLELINMEVGT